jgi:pyridoxamine 5'-phosphate oxidase
MPRQTPSRLFPATAPLKQFHRWFERAKRAGHLLPEAMALATADGRGRPSVRLVLLKDADERGFVFYTNAGSRKGRELRANPRAAAVFHWDRLRLQVRLEGRVESVTEAEADAYWATRPRESQLAALASAQSAELESRAQLVERWRQLRHRYRGKVVPRPRRWTGFRIVADAIEFWTNRDHRLHDRELFVRVSGGWKRKLLQP